MVKTIPWSAKILGEELFEFKKSTKYIYHIFSTSIVFCLIYICFKIEDDNYNIILTDYHS